MTSLTPEIAAIHAWVRDDAPVTIKMVITPKLIAALAARLDAVRQEGSAGDDGAAMRHTLSVQATGKSDRAEGVAALQQAGELFAENAKKSSAKQIAENANCYQQAGEPVAQWVMVPREPTSDMLAAADSAIPRFEEESDGSRLMGVDGALDAWKAMIAVSPLPQQTALVEQGVEKIIAQHEPAACGASAPSEAPLSAEEVDLPNYWRAVIGDTYKPAVLRNVKHMHPATVKEVFDRHAGTDVADVIAGLIFKNQIANNRSEFFAEEYAKATATPPPPTDGEVK